jgi:hypothetical protein
MQVYLIQKVLHPYLKSEGATAPHAPPTFRVLALECLGSDISALV